MLTVGEEWTVLLEEDARTISYVPSPEVKERTVCELPATRLVDRTGAANPRIGAYPVA